MKPLYADDMLNLLLYASMLPRFDRPKPFFQFVMEGKIPSFMLETMQNVTVEALNKVRPEMYLPGLKLGEVPSAPTRKSVYKLKT